MTLKLYYFPLSPPSRAVLSFLILNNIPFERIVIDITKGEQKSSEYLKINPLGLVPAIDDDGFLVNESETIIRYLINTRAIKDQFYPRDPKQKVLIDRYLPFHHSQVGFHSSRYFQSSHPQLYPGLPYTPEQAKLELLDTYDRFERYYLKGNKYIGGGDEISIADLFAVNYFSQVYYGTGFDYSGFPKLKAYIERVLENEVLRELHVPLKEFAEVMKSTAKVEEKKSELSEREKTKESKHRRRFRSFFFKDRKAKQQQL